MSDEKKLPQGRLGRLARLAAAGVRSGASALLARDGTDAARQAAEALGTLRGLAAKVGQMASYVDGLVPEGQRDAYEVAMRALRAQAPRSSPAEIRRLIEEQLGAPLDRLFASFVEEPIASASIGQVHRAVLQDGTEVAVKVQHPGIVRAVESDLRNAGILETLVTLGGGRRLNAAGMLEVARRRFREELDYRMEAGHIAFFQEVHEGDPRIHIPRVIAGHSADRVLTMELCRGASFEEACAAPEPARRAWAETLWRFVFKGNLIGGRFNADPHPGNYLFLDAGRIVFLDFGCVQPIQQEQREAARAMHRAALRRDEPAFLSSGSAMLGIRPGPLEALAHAYLRRCFEPLFLSPYRITRPYAASLVEDMKVMALRARGVRDEEFFPMPAEMLFMNRLQFGFYSVLARLDVEVDYATVEAAFLPP